MKCRRGSLIFHINSFKKYLSGLRLKFLILVFYVILSSISFTSLAKGVSPYLPLQLDPTVELEIQRLATVAKLPLLTKPYHIATVHRYLKKISRSHPTLYNRLNKYMKRYKKSAAITHAKAEISYANIENVLLANQRGQMLDANYNVSLNGFWQANEYMIVNGGGRYYENGDYIGNSFVSLGWDFFQVDIGYREHWISPFQDGAVLLSTAAKPPVNVTISNPTLLTDFNIKYEMSIGILETHEGIQFDRDEPPVSGEPALLMMHLSAQPFDWWTIGLNRTFQFGGDESVTLSDIWQAIIDPVNADNCGGNGTELQDCSQEFGNQQASITNKFDVSLFDIPFSMYYEYAGEDTNNYTNYRLANLANSFGVFFPYLSDSMALNIEFTTFQKAWYTHHIYAEGYSNDGVKMGHWWGNMKNPKDGIGGESGSVRFDWQLQNDAQLTILYRTANFNESRYEEYNLSHDVELKYVKALGVAFLGVTIQAGETNLGDTYARSSVSYTW